MDQLAFLPTPANQQLQWLSACCRLPAALPKIKGCDASSPRYSYCLVVAIAATEAGTWSVCIAADALGKGVYPPGWGRISQYAQRAVGTILVLFTPASDILRLSSGVGSGGDLLQGYKCTDELIVTIHGLKPGH